MALLLPNFFEYPNKNTWQIVHVAHRSRAPLLAALFAKRSAYRAPPDPTVTHRYSSSAIALKVSQASELIFPKVFKQNAEQNPRK